MKGQGGLRLCVLLCLSLLSSCCAFLLGLLLNSGLRLHTGELRVDEDTSTVFTDDDLLVHLDVQLALWWNLVKAATAGITLHIDNAETIAGTFADALEAGQQTRLAPVLWLSP